MLITPSAVPVADCAALLARLEAAPPADLLVIGSGTTRLGVASDAAVRGFETLLLETEHLAKGTSSRATKLVYGGARYLTPGKLALVREALHKRAALCYAPHRSSPLAFMRLAYRRWQPCCYGLGLAVYDRLAGRDALGRTERLDRARTLLEMPAARADGLRGDVHWDRQFDDERLAALAIPSNAAEKGAVVLNRTRSLGCCRRRAGSPEHSPAIATPVASAVREPGP